MFTQARSVLWLRRGVLPLLMIALLAAQAAPRAEIKKYSSDAYSGFGVLDGNNQACNGQSPIVFIDGFDAGKGQTTKPIEFRGQVFFAGRTINSNTVVLECPNGNVLPALMHSAITPTEPNGASGAPECDASFEVTTFQTTSTFAGAVPDGWCELVINDGTDTWHFPNAWRKDTVSPTVAVNGALITGRADATPGGQGLISFSVDDANNGFSDPDGACNDSTCNQTANLFGAQVYFKLEGNAWGTKSGTTSGQATTFEGPATALVSTNRNDPATSRACYALQLLDSAANLSGFGDPNGPDGVPGGGDDVTVAASARPRCFVPDGKAPEITKMEVYFDSTLLNKLPQASDGAWVVNKDESEAPVAHKDKVVYLKIYASEPLFDPQAGGTNKFGSPVAMTNGLDDDGDGNIDEEIYNGADDDGDLAIDEDPRLAGCVVTAATPDDRLDNDCDGYIDEDNSGGTDTGSGIVCGAKEKHLYTQEATCVPLPQLTVTGADPDGTLADQLLTINSTPSAFRTLSETVYVFSYNVANIADDDDYTFVFTMSDGVGNTATNVSPLTGGVVRVDNTAPTYKAKYYSDPALLSEKPKTGSPLLPLAGLGNVILKIEAIDPNSGLAEEVNAPVYKVDQPGTTDATDQPTLSYQGNRAVYTASYTVNQANGGAYLDGLTTLYFKGKDLAGNWTGGGAGVYITPTEGDQFRIDTTPPSTAAISVVSPLEKTVALSDANGKPTSTPVLRWQTLDTDTTGYNVELAKNKTFSGSAILRQTSVLLTNYPPGLLPDNEKDGPGCLTQADCDTAHGADSGFECEASVGLCRQYYYWRVAPKDVAGNTNYFTDCQDPPTCTTTDPYRFRVDAQPPSMTVELYRNYATGVFTNPLQITSQGIPVAIAGTIYLKLSPSELLGALPTFSINQVGETDATNQPLTETAPGSGIYVGSYVVQSDDGLNFQDGVATITYRAIDTSGNEAINAAPTSGGQFLIDTKPPVISQLGATPSPAGNVTVSVSMVVSEQVQTPVSATVTGDCLGAGGQAPFTYQEATAFLYKAPFAITAQDTTCTATVSVTVTDFANQTATTQATFQVDTLAPVSPVLDLPPDTTNPNNPPSKTLTPLFQWGAVSDAVTYHLLMATTSNFASGSVVIDEDELTALQLFAPNPLPNANGDYYWKVLARDVAGNETKVPQVFKYTTDNTAPAAPTFNTSVPATTKNPGIVVSGTAEPLASVKLYRNGQPLEVTTPQGVQTGVQANASGAWTFIFDNDGDGDNDEDPSDGQDNDEDGLTDEDPPDYPLLAGLNALTAKAVDRAGNEGPLTAIKEVSLDTGPPKFNVSYYLGDPALPGQPQVPIGADGLPQAGVGTLWFKLTANEDLLNDQCKFTVDQPGSTDIRDADCTLITPANKREFKGSYEVRQDNGGAFADGMAIVSASATDLDGNTAANITPDVGGAFRIDTKGASFTVDVYRDSGFNEPLPRDTNLNYVARQGNLYLKVVASESLEDGATLTVNQPGSADDTLALSTITGSQTIFRATYPVQSANGALYQDGVASLSVTGEDLAGNEFSNVTPTTGASFAIDTTPPAAPVMGLPASSTNFTTMNVAITGEPFATAVVKHSRKITDLVVIPDDTADNDGDGRTNEEPGAVNGQDDDQDGFIDEDVSTTSCAAGQYLDGGNCATPTQDQRLSFTAVLNENGQATVKVTTLANGPNLLTAYLTDLAGNTGAGTLPAPVTGTGIEIIGLAHTFTNGGWQLVSIPLFNPITPKPVAGFSLNTDFISVEPPPLNQTGNDPKTLYRAGDDVAAMLPGVGYWVNVPGPQTTITLNGQNSKENVLNLKAGWNLVGPPYNLALPWDSNIKVGKTGTTQQLYALDSTAAQNLVLPSLFSYNPVTKEYTEIPVGSGTFSPFTGYFLYAKPALLDAQGAVQDTRCQQGCQLVLPEAP